MQHIDGDSSPHFRCRLSVLVPHLWDDALVRVSVLGVPLKLSVNSSIELLCIASLANLSQSFSFLAWIGQFYGHKVEGQKPSFFEDLQYLMIGPAWLMSFIYDKFGIKY